MILFKIMQQVTDPSQISAGMVLLAEDSDRFLFEAARRNGRVLQGRILATDDPNKRLCNRLINLRTDMRKYYLLTEGELILYRFQLGA